MEDIKSCHRSTVCQTNGGASNVQECEDSNTGREGGKTNIEKWDDFDLDDDLDDYEEEEEEEQCGKEGWHEYQEDEDDEDGGGENIENSENAELIELLRRCLRKSDDEGNDEGDHADREDVIIEYEDSDEEDEEPENEPEEEEDEEGYIVELDEDQEYFDGDEDEDDEEDDSSIVSQVSNLEAPLPDFIFHFGDIHRTFDLIVSEDSDFYDYVMSEEFTDACGDSPLYYLFKFYRHIGSFDNSIFLNSETLKMLSCIFEYVFQYHGDIQTEEIEKIMSTRNLLFFRMFIESCTSDENQTNYFFQDMINSANFHKDKIDFVLTKYGGLLSPLIFSVFIENSYDDYGNDETYEYLMNIFRNEVQNLTDEQLEIIYSEAEDEIKEIISEY